VPELPEVQTVVVDLNKKIVGYEIVDFWSDWPSAIKNKTLVNFKKEIKNRKILGVRRVGKNIFIDLSGGKTLYIHLKMTGHLLIKSQNTNNKTQTNHNNQNTNNKTPDYFSDRVNSYIHHIWKLEGKGQKSKVAEKTLEFSDVRKFAKIVLDDTQKINDLKEIKKLGIDVMSKSFTLKKFAEILNKKSAKGGSAFGGKAIGLVLLDQELMSGIGNIYRSEILFAAGINPWRKIETLSADERKKIYKSIIAILKKAIKMRGTSDSDYRDTAGAPGNFQKVLRVYRRTGKPCKKCGTIIQKINIGQRSAFYCPKCQK
jgi:formamidopyrimidine-DNA glycosylase